MSMSSGLHDICFRTAGNQGARGGDAAGLSGSAR